MEVSLDHSPRYVLTNSLSTEPRANVTRVASPLAQGNLCLSLRLELQRGSRAHLPFMWVQGSELWFFIPAQKCALSTEPSALKRPLSFLSFFLVEKKIVFIYFEVTNAMCDKTMISRGQF